MRPVLPRVGPSGQVGGYIVGTPVGDFFGEDLNMLLPKGFGSTSKKSRKKTKIKKKKSSVSRRKTKNRKKR